MTDHVEVRRGHYADSVALMQVSAAVTAVEGVEAGLVAMATELNVALLGDLGFAVPSAGPDDLVVAVRAPHAAALAVQGRTTPAQLDPDLLIRKLANSRVMISFFNDLDDTSADPRVPAAQYFGAKGFFADYNAKLDEPLTESVRRAWGEGLTALRGGKLDPDR
ncbi:MAG: hypothetical protein ACO3RG_00455, partial [Nitriliruptoraceae bacterium]